MGPLHTVTFIEPIFLKYNSPERAYDLSILLEIDFWLLSFSLAFYVASSREYNNKMH